MNLSHHFYINLILILSNLIPEKNYTDMDFLYTERGVYINLYLEESEDPMKFVLGTCTHLPVCILVLHNILYYLILTVLKYMQQSMYNMKYTKHNDYTYPLVIRKPVSKYENRI